MLYRVIVLLTIAVPFFAQNRSPEGRRLALVISNTEYQKLPRLSAPANDAQLMADTLTRAGFAVERVTDMRFPDFVNTYERPFLRRVQPGDTVVFYYSGYAAQVTDDDNFLLPVEFEPRSPGNMEERSYHLSRMQHGLENARAGLKILVLEAGSAIDTPIVGATSGLTVQESPSSDMLFAFSTSPGKVIPRTSRPISLFTQALAAKIAQPGLRILDVFGDAKREVAGNAAASQIPFIQENVQRSDFVFTPALPELTVTPPLLAFNSPAWNVTPGTQSLTVYTEGHPIDFAVSVPKTDKWLKATPTAGTAPQLSAPNVTISVSPTDLKPGATYTSTITVSASGAEPQSSSRVVTIAYTIPPKPPEPGPLIGKPYQNRKDREEYLFIPSGQFKMGCVPADKLCKEDERPQHSVTLTKTFWMGRNEVQVSSYRRFVEQTKKKMPPGPLWDTHWRTGDLPIVNVTWENARDYCAWAGGRLPTEAEWEYAARALADNQVYPLADENSRDKANFYGKKGNDIYDGPAPVRKFDPSALGLYDMAGNVWELIRDFYGSDYYSDSPGVDPKGPSDGKQHVIRGGSYDSDPKEHLRISIRRKSGKGEPGVGFRCVLDDTPETGKILGTE